MGLEGGASARRKVIDSCYFALKLTFLDGAPTVTGSHMIQPRISAPKFFTPRDKSNDKPGDVS
jgi:hypothetical protein